MERPADSIANLLTKKFGYQLDSALVNDHVVQHGLNYDQAELICLLDDTIISTPSQKRA